MKNLMIAIIAIAFASCTKGTTGNNVQTDEVKILSWNTYNEPNGDIGRKLNIKIICDTTKVKRVILYKNIYIPPAEYTWWSSADANKVTTIYDHTAGYYEVWYIFRFE